MLPTYDQLSTSQKTFVLKSVFILCGLLLIYVGWSNIKTKSAVLGKVGSTKLTGNAAVVAGIVSIIIGIVAVLYSAIYIHA